MLKRPHLLAGIFFILWTGSIFFCYLHNLSFSLGHDNFVLDDILIGTVLVFISLFAGNSLTRFFHLENSSILEEALFSVGIGAGFLSTAVFMLGLLHLLFPWAVAILLIAFFLLGASNYEYGKKIWERVKKFRPTPLYSELVIILLTFVFVVLTFLNTLTPPISRDALIHHLAIPKWYIKHHGIVDIPFSMPSYYPPLMEMLYSIAILISSDILAKLIHFFFYVGSLLFTYALGRLLLTRFASLFAVLLFGSLPVVCQVSSTAYADLGLTFFTLGGFFALFRWSQTRNKGWFCLGALMTGWAVGCKYNGLIVIFSFLMGIILVLSDWEVPLKSLVKNILVFLLVILTVNILWLARNYWFSGNPVYPLANSIIGKPWLPHQPKFSQYQIRKMLFGETLWDQILLPWNLSIKTKSRGRHELDGVISPIFLIFLPPFIFLSKKPKELKWLSFFCLLYFLFFWVSSRIRLRYLMPIYPMLGIITSYAIAKWEIKWKKLLLTLPLCLAFLLNFYWVLIYTFTIKPLDFLVGKESRRDFLVRHIPSYPVFEFINSYLPQNARIMFLYGGSYGNDGYYLDRDYFYDSRYMGYTGKEILNKVTTPEEVREEFLRMKISHFLINWKRLQMDYSASLSKEKKLLFKKFCREFLRLEFKHDDSSLYRLL